MPLPAHPPSVSVWEGRKRALEQVSGKGECCVRVPGRGSVSQPIQRFSSSGVGSQELRRRGCAVGPPRGNPPERWMSLRPSRRGGRVRQNKLHDPILSDFGLTHNTLWRLASDRPQADDWGQRVNETTAPHNPRLGSCLRSHRRSCRSERVGRWSAVPVAVGRQV